MDKILYRKRYAKFAELLKIERKKQGLHLTQEELAKRLGLTQEQISRIEAGHRRIDIIELLEYCSVTGIDMHSFLVNLHHYLHAYSLWPYKNKKVVKDVKKAVEEICRNVK